MISLSISVAPPATVTLAVNYYYSHYDYDKVIMIIIEFMCITLEFILSIVLLCHYHVAFLLITTYFLREVVLMAEEPEDMWHAYNLIQVGDTLKSTTIRYLYPHKFHVL